MKAHFKLKMPTGVITIDLEELGIHEDVSFENLCEEHKNMVFNAIKNSIKDLIKIIPV